MDSFSMNGYLWRIIRVNPHSPYLVDRTNQMRVATTDPNTFCIYLSDDLEGDFLTTVLLHELGHCVIISYDLLGDIHSIVNPEHWIEAEEWVCNFIADYGRQVFQIAQRVLGDKAWQSVPYKLNQIIA